MTQYFVSVMFVVGILVIIVCIYMCSFTEYIPLMHKHVAVCEQNKIC